MPPELLKRCQFCQKAFTTQRAVNQHISASKNCLKDWHKNIIKKNDNPSPKRRRINSPEPSLLDDIPNVDLTDADTFIPHPEPRQQTPSHQAAQATVEDPDDEDADDLATKSYKRYVEPFPGPAGEALRQEKTHFEVLQRKQQLDQKNPWEPFASREEWGLVGWLMKNVGQKSTDEYLRLPIVS
jgi:hypothetical protein